MSNKKRKEEVADNASISPVSQSEEVIIDQEGSEDSRADRARAKKAEEDEKVEVFIKEVVRIRPQDFQAFKHALEDFVKDWD